MVDDLETFKRKYAQKLKRELETKVEAKIALPESKSYIDFKKDRYPTKLSVFETVCKLAERIINVTPDSKEGEKTQQALTTAHVNATPTGVFSLSLIVPILVLMLGFLLNGLVPLLFGTSAGSFGLFLFGILAVSSYFVVNKLPFYIETEWRMQAASEMVLSVFYIVTYMRHTSNLENALAFAAEHLTGPLSLDLKKVLWDVETEQYESVKESLDDYLDFWKQTNMEYVEAMHLIEASLYESAESRRIDLLEKSLDVILDETYEKMLHYAQNLKSPITTLHMMGVILPILGLVMLPLIGGFMTADTHPIKIVVIVAGIYNLAIPLGVYYFGRTILSTRPGGYSDMDLTKVKQFKKYQGFMFRFGKRTITISPLVLSLIIGLVCILVAASPLIIKASTQQDLVYYTPPNTYTGGQFMLMPFSSDSYPATSFQMLGYKKSELPDVTGLIGPYGLGASLLSLFLPLGLGLMVGLYYRYKTKNLMEIRESSKQLENEFASSLFQLGNRLGDGLPAEIAFQRVSIASQGTLTGKFFQVVSENIQRLGLSVRDALFDPFVGAVRQFPSNLIESSMKVLIQASKKGPIIAAQALINISKYVKEIHRVDERLKDLMSDIISSMKSQISFLTPVIAAVVVGITSMVTFILSRLKVQIDNVTSAQSAGSSLGGMSGLLNMFGDGVPTYYLQIVIGIYVVELVFLLTSISSKIENGADSLAERSAIGKNMVKSALTYAVLAFVVMLLFNLLAANFVKLQPQ